MLDVMIKKNGQRVDINPYKWVYTEDGLPANPDDPEHPRVFYVRLDSGRTEVAYYNGTVLDKWLSLSNSNLALNENEIIAWRYQHPRLR